MIEILVSFFLLAGAILMLLASIGIIRLPDLLTRMHATTKSGAMGVSLIMIAVALAFMEPAIIARSIAIICFILLTAPVAAHVIGRAAYFVGVPLWSGSVKDQLKDNYDPVTHSLNSGLEENDEAGEDDEITS